MALILTGAGGLFTRLGHLIYGVNDIVNPYRGTALGTRTDVIQGDYADSDQNLVENIYSQLTGIQNSHTAMINYWRNLAQNTVTQMVNESQTQVKYTYPNALAYLVNYMITNSDTVKRNTVSSVVTPSGGNTGTGVILVGVSTNAGMIQEAIFNESVIVQVTKATVGQETLKFQGAYGVTDLLHWLWPQGSNALVSLTAISPLVSGGSGTKNWLTNGTMELFTANVPDGWSVRAGTPGTSILQDTVTYYDGSSALKFVGDGSEQTTIQTHFGVDFTSNPVASDQLACNLWFKLSAIPSAGVLMVALTNGSGTVLLDSMGAPASFSVDLTTSNTVWNALGGFLRMPAVLPTATYLEISLSTPLQSGHTLNIDRVALARPTAFYTGGPRLACFSGSIPWILGDSYTIAMNNAFDGLIQSGCNKLLNLNQYGLVLPSATGMYTISDTLVA